MFGEHALDDDARHLGLERLRLRDWTLDDADAYYEGLLSDPDVMRYLPGGTPRPREAADKSINWFTRHGEEHGFTLWAVEELSSGALVGNCGLVYIPGGQNGEVEVAYTLAKAFWGKGYATEAAQALVSFARNSDDVRTIRAHTLPEKNASTRVLIKCGFHQAGEVHDPEDGLVWRWELPPREG